jgi:hypothetical protein
MEQNGFYKMSLSLENNLFEDLSHSLNFENIGKGRIGNNLVRVTDRGVPIVRTTTKYNLPAQNFSELHQKLVDNINKSICQHSENIPAQPFNNALAEIYEPSYSKMGYHSDQNLDLEPHSYIGLFSCYEHPSRLSEQDLRKLKIKNKASEEESEISLTHNSCLLFSVHTNSQFLHKIVLDTPQNAKNLQTENKWLGLTFRVSKTFIQFKHNLAYFENGKCLELANALQTTEFYKLRGEENQGANFAYPELTYTISPADLMFPKGC